jgi:uncharacterized membrane protein
MFTVTYLLTGKWHRIDDITIVVLAVLDTTLILAVVWVLGGGAPA